MSAIPETRLAEASSLSLRLLDEIFGPEAGQDMGVILWDGTRWPDERPRRVNLVLNHPGALREMFLPGTEVGMAEAYLYDDFDIQGEIEAIFDPVEIMTARNTRLGERLHLGRELRRLPEWPGQRAGMRGPARLSGKQHSLERDRAAISYHYDVSNDFYRLWLDQRMVYSCAYFTSPDDTLDQAQERKLDYICRKLRLQPGQHLLDIGCGWGGLVIYAAQHYGVVVTGITLSRPQAEMAAERIEQAGLEARARVLLCDYRELDTGQPYDALVSVGMFEHVGEKLLPEYFTKAFRLVKPGGVFLNHGIGRRYTDDPEADDNFNHTYVFPDGELEPISVVLQAAEETGFEVRDVENLREHYKDTLRRWVSNLEAHHEDAMRFVDEPTYRVWRLYMSGSAHGFDHGRLKVYQSLLSRPDERGRSGLPLTRREWYA